MAFKSVLSGEGFSAFGKLAFVFGTFLMLEFDVPAPFGSFVEPENAPRTRFAGA